MEEREAQEYQPIVVMVDEKNKMREIRSKETERQIDKQSS